MTDVTPHDLHVLLVKIEANTEAMKADLARHLRDDERVHNDHENRLRKMERVAYGIGAIVLIGGGGSIFTIFG